MKILLNRCYGGFELNDETLKVFEALGVDDAEDLDRDDPQLIEIAEKFGADKISGEYANLALVEIPDYATDWDIIEEDGAETIVYVVDGKLHFN